MVTNSAVGKAGKAINNTASTNSTFINHGTLYGVSDLEVKTNAPNNLIELLSDSAALQGFIMAMLIAAIRSIYFGERKIIRIGMETLLCGFLSLGAAGLIDLVEALFLKEQLPETVLLTVCSMVGFIGVATLSEFLKKFLNNNAGKKPHNRYNRYNDDDEDEEL